MDKNDHPVASQMLTRRAMVESLIQDLKNVSDLISKFRFKTHKLLELVINQLCSSRVPSEPGEMVGVVLSHLQAARNQHNSIVEQFDKIGKEIRDMTRPPSDYTLEASASEAMAGLTNRSQMNSLSLRFEKLVRRHRTAVNTFHRLGFDIMCWLGGMLRMAYARQRASASSKENKMSKWMRVKAMKIGRIMRMKLTKKRPMPTLDPCAICLDDIEEELGGAKQSCEHMFHFECIENWLDRSINCPVCRKYLSHPMYPASQLLATPPPSIRRRRSRHDSESAFRSPSPKRRLKPRQANFTL